VTIKYIYEPTLDVKSWFPGLVVEQWLDPDFTVEPTAPPAGAKNFYTGGFANAQRLRRMGLGK